MTLVRRLAAVAGTGAAAVAWAALVERHLYAIRSETLPLLRAGAVAPLRVLVWSDLHLLPGQRRRVDFVRRAVERTGPDLLVSAGDNLEHPDVVEDVVALHRDVVQDRPAVAVLGAHDRWGPSFRSPVRYLAGPSRGRYGQRLDEERLVGGLEDAGWVVLRNRGARVATSAGPVDVVGLGDAHVDHDAPEEVDWPPSDASTGASPAVLRLGVAHAPYRRVLEAFDRRGFDLALCGHTHGGQLRVPGWGALVTNSDLPAAQARGTSRFGADLWLHVSAGLGHSTYAPARFACRPELSVLDLVPRLP